MHRIVFALLAAIGAMPTSAQSLRDAVESAWARQPAAQGVITRNELFNARLAAAGALFPAPPSASFAHRTDQIDRNRGARELEGELAFPLWTPGAKARGLDQVDAEKNRFDAQIALAKWRIAGEVRDSLWQARLADNERGVALRKVEEAKLLASDVLRRVKAGDLAPVDANQAQGAVQLAEVALIEAELRRNRSLYQFKLLTGLTALPGDRESPPPENASQIDAHPQLVAGAKSIEAARTRLSQASNVSRDPPELAVGVRSERMQSGERYDNSLRVGIRIPFGTAARNRPRIAEANAELIESTAEGALARQSIEAEVAMARAAVQAAESIESIATERLRLIQTNRDLYDRAFRLGELDFPARLRAENERFDALLALERARADSGRAIARLNQSLGLLP